MALAGVMLITEDSVVVPAVVPAVVPVVGPVVTVVTEGSGDYYRDHSGSILRRNS